MSENDQKSGSPSKHNNKRKPYLQRRLPRPKIVEQAKSKEVPGQRNREAEQNIAISATVSETISGQDIMPPPPLGLLSRRASIPTTVPAKGTPFGDLPEWTSTQSCPTTAVGAFKYETTPEILTPEIVQADSEDKTPRTTFDRDYAIGGRAAAASVSTVSSASEQQIFNTLASHSYFVPVNASLNTSSLILFKHNTPSLERFRLLHNQLFVELGRVSFEQIHATADGFPPEANAEAYREREEVMMGLLTEVVPALNHLAEAIGREVGRGIKEQRAGLRLWAGERGENEGRSG